MSLMTVDQAASSLDVSNRQVRRLVETGDLTVAATAGRSYLLDARSVHQLKRFRRSNARPLSTSAAWAVLAILSGEGVDWLDNRHHSRLQKFIKESFVDQLAWALRSRASSRRMRSWGSSEGLLLTGSSVLTDDRFAKVFDLSSAASSTNIDAYVAESRSTEVFEALGLTDSATGDATIRVVTDNDGFRDDRTLIAMVAVDLYASLDTRESSAGKRVLEELMAVNG